MSDAISPHKRRWFQFSLRTILLLILGLCATIGYFLNARKLYLAEQELHARRNESGYLSVDDRTQLHAIALNTDDPNTWRWRLFIPRGQRYSWNISSADIPQNDVPQEPEVAGHSNEPYWEQDHEVLVTARLRRTNDEFWELSVESRIGDSKDQMYGASLRIPDEKLRWMSEISSTDGQVIGGRGAELRDPDRPVILLQRRPCKKQADGSYLPSPDPMPGFMIWLAPEP